MQVTIVQVAVKPECIGDFIEATHANHTGSIAGPGRGDPYDGLFPQG